VILVFGKAAIGRTESFPEECADSMTEWDFIMIGVWHLTDWRLLLEVIARIILS
jgi:hypothetical protein